jgi:hypothetical protein
MASFYLLYMSQVLVFEGKLPICEYNKHVIMA